MFQGYDMSQLLSNASKPMEAFRVREAKRKEMSKAASPFIEVPLKIKPVESDPVQELITAGDLDQHPEYRDQLLKEMGLTKFWDYLMNSEDHSTVVPLATNRILNFYEGATKGGLSASMVKTGLITLIMLSTVVADRDNAEMPYAAGPLGILHPRIKCTLPAGSEIGVNDNMALLSAEKAVTYISKVTKPDPNKVGADRLGTYVLNALRMWVVSSDDEVLDFMGRSGERMRYMKTKARNSFMVRSSLLSGAASLYNRAFLLDFTTPWATGKSVRRNAAACLNAMCN